MHEAVVMGLWSAGLLVLALLALPADLRACFRAESMDDWEAQAGGGLMARALTVRVVKEGGKSMQLKVAFLGVPIFQRAFKPADSEGDHTPSPEKEQAKGGAKRPWGRWAWDHRRRLFHDLVQIRWVILRFRVLGRLDYGFESPATTGEMFGFFCILNEFRPRWMVWDARPDFLDKRLSGEVRGRILLMPLFLILYVLYLGVEIFILTRSERWKKYCIPC